jgi:trimeric autotransporter adhesin
LERRAGREMVWYWRIGELEMKSFVLAIASVVAVGIAAPAFGQASDQIGPGNTATVSQTASGGADYFSDLYQEGTGDMAKVTQSGIGGSRSSGIDGDSGDSENWWDNESWIHQYGGNSADVSQTISDALNSSSIRQEGNDNIATVSQYGESDNSSAIIQYGANNSATVNQSGAAGLSNSSSVTQTRGSIATVTR